MKNTKILGVCALLSCLVAVTVTYTMNRRRRFYRLVRISAGESTYERKHRR